MADPLSIAASVTGVLAFTAKLTREVITLVSDVRDAPQEIVDLRFELEHLSSLLHSAHDLSLRNPLRPEDKPLEATVEDCLDRCQEVMRDIKDRLSSFLAKGSGRRSPRRFFNSTYWYFRKGEITKFKERLRNSRAMLDVSVSVLNGHLVGKGQQEIRDEMSRGMDRLAYLFESAENARKFHRRLQDDLESVSAFGGRRASVSDATDAGLPMRKYLEQYHNTTSLAPPTVVMQEDPPDGDSVTLASASEMVAEETPSLVQAAQAGNAQQARALISLGAEPSARLHDGRTALHFCAIYDDVATAEVLLEHGAEVDATDQKSRAPMRVALSSESYAVAALLLRKGCAVEKLLPALLDAVRDGEGIPGFKDFLAALRERLDVPEGTPHLLHEVIGREDDTSLRLLLEGGFDPSTRDACGISPIHHAIILKRQSTVKLLLEHGADKNDYLPPETHDRLREEIAWHRPLFPMLVSGITPIATAARAMTDPKMLLLLLEAGADPNWEYPSDGVIALIGLCASQYLDSAKLLVDFGSHVNHKNHTGHSALYWSVVCGNDALLQHMLDRGGGDLGIVCEADGRWTLLHAAAYQNRADVARTLVARGADLLARDARGLTPADVAVAYGNGDMARFLGEKTREVVEASRAGDDKG